MISKEEIDQWLKDLPGKKYKKGKNSKETEKAILELKRLRFENFYHDEDEEKEYRKEIDSLLRILGEI